MVKGWHARPVKETVSIHLRQQADRSPSGTGRAAYDLRAVDSRLRRVVRVRLHAGAAERSGPSASRGGPDQKHGSILTGSYAL